MSAAGYCRSLKVNVYESCTVTVSGTVRLDAVGSVETLGAVMTAVSEPP